MLQNCVNLEKNTAVPKCGITFNDVVVAFHGKTQFCSITFNGIVVAFHGNTRFCGITFNLKYVAVWDS